MLTKEQEKFITDLSKELEKCNSSTDIIGFGLDEIVNETNKRQLVLEEGKKKKEALLIMLTQKMNNDVDKIKKPLEKLGFTVRKNDKLLKFDISINVKSTSSVTGYFIMGIDVKYCITQIKNEFNDYVPFDWYISLDNKDYIKRNEIKVKTIEEGIEKVKPLLKEFYQQVNIKK